MQKLFRSTATVALAVGVITLIAGERAAVAQGTGTLEVTVKHNGPPILEIIRLNKDTKVCGTEARLEKVVVGPTKGLANAVVFVPSATGSGAKPVATEPTLNQKGCKFVPHVVAMQP